MDWGLLIFALMWKETAVTGFDPFSVGDEGKALGLLQIHQCVIDDVNKYYFTNYVHSDAYDFKKASDICQKYLSMWGTAERLGREPTVTDLARIWNGGPNGWKKDSTMNYGNDVTIMYNNLSKQGAKINEH